MLNATAHVGTGLLATLVGVVLLLVGASSVVIELQNDLNRIWRAPKRDHSGYTKLIRTRLLAFGLILGFGFLLLVSLIVSVGLSALVQHSRMFAQQGLLLHALNTLVSIGAYSALFAMLFKFLPNISLSWGDVWRGALVTAVLFSIGQLAIGYYLGRSATTSAYAGRGLAAGAADVAVLCGADLPLRRRIHLGIGAARAARTGQRNRVGLAY